MDPTLTTIFAAAIGGIATVVAAWLAHRQNAGSKQQDPVSMSKPSSTLAPTIGSVGSSTGSLPIAKIGDVLSMKATAGPAAPVPASSTPSWAQSGRITDANGTTVAV